LPFVAFATGAIPEVTGGRGLLVPEGDIRGFQQALKRLISDPEFRVQTAEISRTVAGELPSWRQTGEAFLRAVEEII
jgi:glycosyltransferase involved in cell wall biosynthesis